LAQVEDRDEVELYRQLLDADLLRRGLAMHHAGLLPYLKEVVEVLFQQGLIKVVFATETLSLGIHMPAKAVVVSSFTKFDGQNFQPLTSGELTQLMGRAGRRGIDPIGHGIILKEPDVDIGTIYEAATGEEMTVESKFAPTYNMALNLLRYYRPEEADELMERSFGQYQKMVARCALDGRVSILEQRLADLSSGRFAQQGDPCCTERTISSFTHAEDEIASLRARMRRLRREHWQRGRRGGRRATKDPGGKTLNELRGEQPDHQSGDRGWLARGVDPGRARRLVGNGYGRGPQPRPAPRTAAAADQRSCAGPEAPAHHLLPVLRQGEGEGRGEPAPPVHGLCEFHLRLVQRHPADRDPAAVRG